MDVPLQKDITYFAKTNFRGTSQMFGIKRKDRRQHMYVLGKSGTGKSVMLSNMIVQNIKNGEGVCVVDPHGELVEEILHSIPPERVKDVIYFNPADTDFHLGFNVLQLDDPKYKHLVASGLMGIFTKIWANAWSSRMEYILNNAILALLDTPGTTLLGIPRLLVDKDYRQSIINNLKDPVVKAFWIHEYEAWRDQFRNEAIAPIQNKVGQFLSTSIVRNVVGQSKSTINIFDIMNTGKIFLVNVSKGRIGEDNSALLGGMIITKLQLAAMERVRILEKDRKDFYLYVDEFQNFVTDSFASILSEARKYRLCLTLAHQYIAQLVTDSSAAVRDAVFGNVGTMVIFRIGAADADFLEKEFEPEFLPENLVALPNYHIYLKLMVDGVTSRPFSAKTLPPIEIDHDANVAEQIINASRELYARPREVVESEISHWSESVGGEVEVEGKFKAVCSNCGKSVVVPFEPVPGRPVYCKDCMFKIKSGELKPESGFKMKREKEENHDMLSMLGIEFKDMGKGAQKIANDIRKSSERRIQRAHSPLRPQSPFKRPEEKRKGPDIAGLKAAISSVLSNNAHSKEKTAVQQAPEPEVVIEKPEKKMSLAELKQPEQTNNQQHAPQQPLAQKNPSAEHVSALKDAIAKAGKLPSSPSPVEKNEEPQQAFVAQPMAAPAQPQTGPSAEEIEAQRKRIEEEKERALKEAEEAKRRADEAERLTAQKEAEFARQLEEERQKVLEETRKREEEHEAELKAEAAKAAQNMTKGKNREVPEDVLKKLLE